MATPKSDKRKADQLKWDHENTRVFRMKLNLHTDADIIAYLDKQPSKQGYIKQLIREDIKKVGE